jgi:hypothetical protein
MRPRALESAFDQNPDAGSESERVEEGATSATTGLGTSPGKLIRHIVGEQSAEVFGIDAKDSFEEGGQPTSLRAHSRSAPAAPSASLASLPSLLASAASAALPERVIR